MTRVAIWTIVLGISGASLAGGQGQEGAGVLAEMRQALGGDTALSAVRTFAANGTWRMNVGPRILEREVDIECELPDKYVRTSRQAAGPFQVTMSDGFNGNDPIRRLVAPGGPPPQDFATGPQTPERIAAARAAMALSNKHAFAPLALALFGASFAGYPLEFRYVGQESLDGASADVVEAKANDGRVLRLFVAARTRLPIMISWSAPPLIIMTKTSVVAVKRGEVKTLPSEVAPPTETPVPPPGGIVLSGPPPPGNPAAGQALVEHRLFFSDYRTVDGLTWPHVLKETVDGQFAEEIRFRHFRINPSLDPGTFKPTK